VADHVTACIAEEHLLEAPWRPLADLEGLALLHMEIQGSHGTRFASALKVTP